MEVNEEKRNKFMEYAGKRVNNVMHDIQILEPMARSSSYDFTKEDVEEMFNAMQETLNDVKSEFYKKFEEKTKSEKKVFSFGTVKSDTKINVTLEDEKKINAHEINDNNEPSELNEESAKKESTLLGTN